MLYWTCPECGRECSPAVRECPACSPRTLRQSPVESISAPCSANGILALAESLESVHTLERLELEVEGSETRSVECSTATAELVAEDLCAELDTLAVEDRITPAEEALLLLAEETLAVPETLTVDALVRPLVESVGPHRTEPEHQTPAAVAETEAQTAPQSPDSALPPAPLPETQDRSETTEPQLAAVLLDQEDSESLWEPELAAEAQNRGDAEASAPELQLPGERESEASAEPHHQTVSSAAQSPSPELLPQEVAECAQETPPAAAVPVDGQIPPARPEPLLLAAPPGHTERLLLMPAAPAATASPAEELSPAEPPFDLTSTTELQAAAAEEPPACALGSETQVPVSENQLALELTAAAEPVPAAHDAESAEEAKSKEVCEALSIALQAHAEILLNEIEVALNAARAAEQAGIAIIAASFERRTAHLLLASPADLVMPPAPPAFEWLREGRPALQPLKPPPANLAALMARPATPPLAGPCLTRQLLNVADSDPTKPSHRSGGLRNWVPSLMGGTLLVILIGLSLQYLSVQGDAKSSTPAPSQSTAIVSATTDALARSVEISGLRLVKNWSGKQQVRFLVINHSSQDLLGVLLQVDVKASDAAGGGPILTIRAPIRSLEANQSKEIKTTLDSEVPDSALADWETVRTEVQIFKE